MAAKAHEAKTSSAKFEECSSGCTRSTGRESSGYTPGTPRGNVRMISNIHLILPHVVCDLTGDQTERVESSPAVLGCHWSQVVQVYQSLVKMLSLTKEKSKHRVGSTNGHVSALKRLFFSRYNFRFADPVGIFFARNVH